MNDYINVEIAKNIKGMSEMIGKDESKYWYFAGKVEALSLLKKEMESTAIIVSDKTEIKNTIKDDRPIAVRFNEMFGLSG